MRAHVTGDESNHTDADVSAAGPRKHKCPSNGQPLFRFPPLFYNDFGPSALLSVQPSLSNAMSYGEDVTNSGLPAPLRLAQSRPDPVGPESGAITPDNHLPACVQMTKLIVKPDQLIKRRSKAGLLALNKDWQDAK